MDDRPAREIEDLRERAERAERESDQAQREHDRLQRENDRLRQQIDHLKRQVDEARRVGFRSVWILSATLSAISTDDGSRLLEDL